MRVLGSFHSGQMKSVCSPPHRWPPPGARGSGTEESKRQREDHTQDNAAKRPYPWSATSPDSKSPGSSSSVSLVSSMPPPGPCLAKRMKLSEGALQAHDASHLPQVGLGESALSTAGEGVKGHRLVSPHVCKLVCHFVFFDSGMFGAAFRPLVCKSVHVPTTICSLGVGKRCTSSCFRFG